MPTHVTSASLPTAHVVYTATIMGIARMPIYVGCCPLVNLHRITDAINNTEWQRIVKPSDPLTLSIVALVGSQEVAEATQAALVAAMKPHCNVHGNPVAHLDRVRCVETGSIYDSVGEAARAFNVSRQAVSAHLNGRGSKRVAGHTFERCE